MIVKLLLMFIWCNEYQDEKLYKKYDYFIVRDYQINIIKNSIIIITN